MYFFTATINSWQNLLEDEKIKQIIVDSLVWLYFENKINIHGFVIMPNHIHILWTHAKNIDIKEVENSLLKYNAHEFKKYLQTNNPELLENYVSTQKDRKYHFWERRAKVIEIKNKLIAEQKLTYIHNNPLQEKWKLVDSPEDYYFSSAAFYEKQDTRFSFLIPYHFFI